MNPRIVLLASLGLAACSPAEAPSEPASLAQQGKAIADANCSGCHAVDATSESPHPDAPAFRSLSEKYPVADLSEALAEGIMVGHPDMPEFTFDPQDADALIAFIETLQPGAGD